MKLIYIDVETTGIAFPQSGLIQLAGAIEIEGQKPQTFQYHVKPFPNDIIDEEALSINGITREEMASFDNPRKVYRNFISLLGLYVAVAKVMDASGLSYEQVAQTLSK